MKRMKLLNVSLTLALPKKYLIFVIQCLKISNEKIEGLFNELKYQINFKLNLNFLI